MWEEGRPPRRWRATLKQHLQAPELAKLGGRGGEQKRQRQGKRGREKTGEKKRRRQGSREKGEERGNVKWKGKGKTGELWRKALATGHGWGNALLWVVPRHTQD